MTLPEKQFSFVLKHKIRNRGGWKRGRQLSSVVSARYLPVPSTAHLNVTHGGGERQSVIELQAKPDPILWLCAVHRSVLP